MMCPERRQSSEQSQISAKNKTRGTSIKNLAKSKNSSPSKVINGDLGQKDEEKVPGEKRNKFYTDLAIIRRRNQMTGQILSDNHFLTKFSSKSQTDKDITSVQTCLKYKSGLGKPFFVKFYANINWREPNNKILYDLKAFGEEHELIEYDEQTYCMV